MLIDAEEGARAALGRLVAMWAAGDVSEEEFAAGRTAANERLTRARAKLERGRRELERMPLLSDDEYVGLRGVTREVWDALSVEAQHDIYRVVVDRVVVHPFGTEPRREIHWRP